MAASTRTIYVNGTIFATSTANEFSDTVATDLFQRMIVEPLDWGTAPVRFFERDRPLLPGKTFLGQVADARDFTLSVLSRLNHAAAGYSASGAEGSMESELEALIELFDVNTGRPIWIRQDSVTHGGTAKSRQIKAYPKEVQSWKWNRSAVDAGWIGPHFSEHVMLSVNLRAQFPWWSDVTAQTSSSNTLDTTLRSGVLANNGSMPCGLKITIAWTTATGASIICNIPSPTYPHLAGQGLTLTNFSGTSPIVIDIYATDPLVFTALQGSTNVMGSLAVGDRLALEPGNNTVQWKVTGGTLTGGTISFSWYPLNVIP